MPKTAPIPPIVLQVCKALDDKKAGEIRVLQVREQSSITDYLIIATGTSDPHLRALRVELEKVLDSSKVHIVGMDTSQESGWLVIDAFDVMIHVMTPDNREKYALENLWKDAEEISVEEITAPPPPPKTVEKKTRTVKKAAKAPKAKAKTTTKPAPKKTVAKKAAAPRKPRKKSAE